MIILFCGPDTSGKDSLMHELSKKYTYYYYMSPRSPICNIVYDLIYKRVSDDRLQKNFQLIGKLLELGACFIYIKVKPAILVSRAIARNEKHVNTLANFKQHIAVYDEIFKECKKRFKEHKNKFIEIDNSGSLDHTVSLLKEKLTDVIDQIEFEDASECLTNREIK